MGQEWLVDASGCRPGSLRDAQQLAKLFHALVAALELTAVGPAQWHTFPGEGGVTGLQLLSESHLAIHTFPEHGFAALSRSTSCRTLSAPDFEAPARAPPRAECRSHHVRRAEAHVKAGQCPGCGAPIEFPPGTGKIKVCEHCHTVVLRGEANLESRGKVADLVDTDSPLKVGLTGRANGVGFRIVGRIQKTQGKAPWDEWCLALDDGRTAWLSESEGEWNLMDEAGDVQMPPFDRLKPLAPFNVHDKRFVIEERRRREHRLCRGRAARFSRNLRVRRCDRPQRHLRVGRFQRRQTVPLRRPPPSR